MRTTFFTGKAAFDTYQSPITLIDLSQQHQKPLSPHIIALDIHQTSRQYFYDMLKPSFIKEISIHYTVHDECIINLIDHWMSHPKTCPQTLFLCRYPSPTVLEQLLQLINEHAPHQLKRLVIQSPNFTITPIISPGLNEALNDINHLYHSYDSIPLEIINNVWPECDRCIHDLYKWSTVLKQVNLDLSFLNVAEHCTQITDFLSQLASDTILNRDNIRCVSP
ncbi:MAG: hypothetical protein ACON5A_03615 [Candidatus Comchoanobacterales bacterium]